MNALADDGFSGTEYAIAALTLGAHRTRSCANCRRDGAGCLALEWAREVYRRHLAVAALFRGARPEIRAGHVSTALGRLL